MKRRNLLVDATALVIGVLLLMSCGRDGRNGTARDGAAAAKPEKQESVGKPVAKATTQSKTETIAEVKVEKARGGEAPQKAASTNASPSASTKPRRKPKAKGKLIYYYLPG